MTLKRNIEERSSRTNSFKKITFFAVCLESTALSDSKSSFASLPQKEEREEKGAIFRTSSDSTSQEDRITGKRKFSEFQQMTITRVSDQATTKKQRTQYLMDELFPPTQLRVDGNIKASASFFERDIPYVATVQARTSNAEKIGEIGDLLLFTREENETLQRAVIRLGGENEELQRALMRVDEESTQLRHKVQKHRALYW